MQAVHRKYVELMPWYVTGTLSADDRREIEAHLKTCLSCRAALREEQRVHQLVAAEDGFRMSPERGISGLLSRIDGDARPARFAFGSVPRLAYGLGLAAVLAVGGLIGSQLLSPPDGGDDPFTTLSDAPAGAGDRIDIVFADELDRAAIERMIRELGGRLVAGPSALGRYTVALAPGEAGELDALIERLAADRRVRFVGRNFIDDDDAGGAAGAGGARGAAGAGGVGGADDSGGSGGSVGADGPDAAGR